MKKNLQINRLNKHFLFTLLLGVVGMMNLHAQSVPTGAINGVFSVGENTGVFFSRGNLQYKASTNKWQFATNQYDYVGNANSNISSTYTGWIDLFGWGTSGYNHGATCYQPWSVSYIDDDYYAYGNEDYNLYDRTGKADWGYNPISNGGNVENSGWRTLTDEEWSYLFFYRVTASGIRYVRATVNNNKGVILLPDDWQVSYYSLNINNDDPYSFSNNVITASQWATLEQHGAVFLPAAGYREGISINSFGSIGEYWTASSGDGVDCAFVAYFDGAQHQTSRNCCLSTGCSVRLVRPVENCSISAIPSPAAGGAVSGTGAYSSGAGCTLMATASAGYTFAYWTQNGRVVSVDATYTFTVGGNRNLVAHFTSNGTSGELNGVFSVGENSSVVFSQGNLQYRASTNTWRFAESQWDYVGIDNANISETNSGLIDLFCWGTSGYSHGAACYQPWSTSTMSSDYYAYGSSSYNLNDQTGKADWGYNAIANGGNTENSGWRTLTHDEWEYLLNTRSTTSNIRYAKAMVNNRQGLILLPDDWQASYYSLTSTNTSNASYSTNVITATQWSTLEQHGAVFFPAAGYRYSTLVYDGFGEYWSASCYNSRCAYYVIFTGGSLDASAYHVRDNGFSVRLVRHAGNYSINAVPNPAAGGTVSGVGAYAAGAGCTLTATASTGYHFVNWTEGGTQVSTNASYQFTVTGARTLIANFTPNNYTVTLNTNGGTINGGNVTSYTYGVGATLPTNVTRTGYSFGGWYDNSGLTGSAVTAISTTATGNKTFWAKWTVNSFTISANANPTVGGTVSGAGTYNHGASCTLTATPATGYNFTKWTKNGTQMSTNATYTFTVSGAGTYVAQFTKKTYTITATANPTAGGTVTGGGTYEHGSSVTLTATPATGYTFTNWKKGNTVVSTNATYSFTATEAATYTATFTLNSYAIAVSANPSAGGTVSGAGNYNYGSSCTLTATPATGYNFTKWTKGGTQVSTNATYTFTVNAAGTYVAQFTKKTYAVTATANPTNGGTVTGAGTYDHGTSVTLTATAAEGYTFVNWTEGGTQVSTNASYQFTLTGARTLVANFNANTYSVTLNTNDGTINSGNVTSYTYGVGATLPTDVTLTGYTFGGWYDNANLTGTAVTSISTTATGDKTYWAKWTINSYTIAASANPTAGGTVTGAGNYNYGSSCTLKATPATGYNFTKWTKDGTQVSTNATYTFTVNAAGTYVAQFTKKTYAVTATANPTNGGTITGGGTYEHGSNVTLMATAATGYTFVKWTKDGAQVSTNPTYSFTATAAGEYVAHFSLNNYEIVVSANPSSGGIVTGAGNYDHFANCTLTATASTGYTFEDWTDNGSAVSTDATHSFTVTGPRILVANFTLNSYEITATADPVEGGTVTGAGTYNHGETVNLSATVNEGYVFDGWSRDGETVSTEPGFSFTATEAADYVAHFTHLSYPVEITAFPTEGGTVTGAGTYYHGDLCTLTAVPNPGYFFVSWTQDGAVVSNDATYSFSVTGPATFVANFISFYFNITVSVTPEGAGTVTGSGSYSFGETCTLTAEADGAYSFVNWTENGEEVSSDATYSFTVTGERSLQANFSLPTQTYTLPSGWSWWSANVEITLSELEEAIGANGINIMSQIGPVDYLPGLGWDGAFSTLDLSQMYQINMAENADVVVSGPAADPADHPVTVNKGWTWIGYPVRQTMTVNAALAGLTPADNDQIQAKTGFAIYNGTGWIGSLNSMNPSQGYMYNSKADGSKTFTYPSNSKGGIVEPNVTDENNFWKANPERFANNMSVLAVVEIDGVEASDDDIEIGAFVGDECRGSIRLMHIDETGRHLAFLTIHGETGEAVSFRVLDGTEIRELDEKITFHVNDMLGNLQSPFVLHASSEELSLFPNPADRDERIRVTLPASIEAADAKVEVYNALGALVGSFQLNGNSELEGLHTTGMYTVKVTDRKGNMHFAKLVVK